MKGARPWKWKIQLIERVLIDVDDDDRERLRDRAADFKPEVEAFILQDFHDAEAALVRSENAGRQASSDNELAKPLVRRRTGNRGFNPAENAKHAHRAFAARVKTRSEEHTSELQSPYVISYAVF